MPYFYGQDCEQKCGFCKNNSACHHESGHCDVGCDPGYVGDTCHMRKITWDTQITGFQVLSYNLSNMKCQGSVVLISYYYVIM